MDGPYEDYEDYGDCFFCHRQAAGIATALPETLHPDCRAAVCGDCYDFMLDVMGDLRFIDLASLWLGGS